MAHLPRSFFNRPTLTVARELLGHRLVHIRNGRRLAGLITETEAYVGQTDLASHARRGRTPRTAAMFGRPGLAYIYFTYGMHWCLNCVTEEAGFPAAVLLRGILPTEGVETMRRLRLKFQRRRNGPPPARLTDGPAKLTQALGIDGRLNGHDLCGREARLFVERGPAGDGSPTLEPQSPVAQGAVIRAGPRVGLGSTPEPWLSKRWNFRLKLARTE